jgi:hypothetical protein
MAAYGPRPNSQIDMAAFAGKSGLPVDIAEPTRLAHRVGTAMQHSWLKLWVKRDSLRTSLAYRY